MKEYSDYIQTTRTYLKRYNQFKATIENLQDDIDGLMSEQTDRLSWYNDRDKDSR